LRGRPAERSCRPTTGVKMYDGRSIIGIVDFILWLDRLFLKPIHRAIPDLDQLLADPDRRFREQPITIGPRRRYVTATLVGILLAMANAGWIFLLFSALLDRRKGPPGLRPDASFLIALLLGELALNLLLSILLVFWFLRGGRMVLTREGAELRYRGSLVFCPWMLFDAPGKPSRAGRNEVLLPMEQDAIPHVTLSRRGQVVARGATIRCRSLRFVEGYGVILCPLCVVKATELADLLLRLGRVLGRSVPPVPIN
jgi:hypothetical protein